jgi:hypothetical protein
MEVIALLFFFMEVIALLLIDVLESLLHPLVFID